MTVARTPLLIRRTIAYFVDLLILFVLVVIVFSLPIQRETKAIAVFIFLFFCPFCEWLLAGRTPGKYVAGIVVINGAGTSPTLVQALIRGVTRDIDASFWFITVLVFESSARCQRMGDMLARTYVLKKKDFLLIQESIKTNQEGKYESTQ